MSDSQSARKFRRIVVYSMSTIFFGLLIIGLLYGLRPMLLPFVLGAFLAYLFKPISRSFQGSSISKFVRAGVLLYFVGYIFYSGFSLVSSSMPNEVEELQLKVRLQYRLNERWQSWMGLKDSPNGNFIYKNFGQELDLAKQKGVQFIRLSNEERKEFLKINKNADPNDEIAKKYYNYYLANLKAQKIDVEKLKSSSLNDSSAQAAIVKSKPESHSLATLLSGLANWIIMPLIFIFVLLDKGQILHFFLRLVPNRYFELSHTVLEKVDEALGKYIRGTMLECSLVGITLIIGFYLCGFELKFAILIGLIGGLTNAIPFFGTALACVLGIGYSLIAEDIQPVLPFLNEDSVLLAVLGVVMIAHLLDNAIYQPLVVGSAVNIHPIAVIVGVFGGSLMFGFAGLIFAIPTIVILKVVTETFFSGLKDYRII